MRKINRAVILVFATCLAASCGSDEKPEKNPSRSPQGNEGPSIPAGQDGCGWAFTEERNPEILAQVQTSLEGTWIEEPRGNLLEESLDDGNIKRVSSLGLIFLPAQKKVGPVKHTFRWNLQDALRYPQNPQKSQVLEGSSEPQYTGFRVGPLVSEGRRAGFRFVEIGRYDATGKAESCLQFLFKDRAKTSDLEAGVDIVGFGVFTVAGGLPEPPLEDYIRKQESVRVLNYVHLAEAGTR